MTSFYPLAQNLEGLLQLKAGKEIQSLSSLDIYIYIYILPAPGAQIFCFLRPEHPKMGYYQWAYLSAVPPLAVPRDAQLASRLLPLPTSKSFTDEQHQFLSQLWLQAELLSILAPGAQARLESRHSRPPTPNSTSALAARRIAAAASWLLLAKLDHSLESPVESWEHHLQGREIEHGTKMFLFMVLCIK